MGDEFEEPEPETGARASYSQAKQQTGFDDDEAIRLFYEVYNDEEADGALRAKAICRAGVLISKRIDLEQLRDSIETIIQCHQYDAFVSDRLLLKTVRAMIGSVLGDQEVYDGFLAFVGEKVDRTNDVEQNLFIDLRLKQAESAIRYDHFQDGEQFLREAEEFCAIPPDHDDPDACRRAIEILVLRIEFAIRERKEDEEQRLGAMAISIPFGAKTPRQQAVLGRVEALQLFKAGQYAEAGAKFFEVLKLCGRLGLANYAQMAIPYWALTRMIGGERAAIFAIDEARPHEHSPRVAPIALLYEAYNRDAIVQFNLRRAEAEKVFLNDPAVVRLIEDVRLGVLKRAVIVVCGPFKALSTDWLAKKVESTRNEIEDIALELIVTGVRMQPGAPYQKLNGLLDPEAHTLVFGTRPAPSVYLEGVPELLAQLEGQVKAFKRARKLPFDHRAWV